MTGLFDTHCHFEGTADETAAALRRAAAAGVKRIMAVGGSDELNRGVAVAFAAGAAAGMPRIFRAIGYDRDQAERANPRLDFSGVDAVGEIGLDYHYDGPAREAQVELFRRQLDLARTLSLPVIIHTREADADTLAALREIPSKGVIHCFTGSAEFGKRLLDLGFYISISGIVTFRAADNVREMAKTVPADRLLIETDAPFLAPVPMRGKPNESAFIVHTAAFLAKLYGRDEDEFVRQTTANSLLAFGLN